MIEVKTPINPIIAYGDDADLKKEEKEIEQIRNNYFGDNDVEVHV